MNAPARYTARISLCLAFVFLFCGSFTRADNNDSKPPDVIKRGFDDYRTHGSKRALETWARYGIMQNSEAVKNYIRELAIVDKQYGRFRGHHITGMDELSPNTFIVYATIEFDRGPLFARFLAYNGIYRSTVVDMKFNILPEGILPDALLLRYSESGKTQTQNARKNK